jgi:hypothetical protein
VNNAWTLEYINMMLDEKRETAAKARQVREARQIARRVRRSVRRRLRPAVA